MNEHNFITSSRPRAGDYRRLSHVLDVCSRVPQQLECQAGLMERLSVIEKSSCMDTLVTRGIGVVSPLLNAHDLLPVVHDVIDCGEHDLHNIVVEAIVLERGQNLSLLESPDPHNQLVPEGVRSEHREQFQIVALFLAGNRNANVEIAGGDAEFAVQHCRWEEVFSERGPNSLDHREHRLCDGAHVFEDSSVFCGGTGAVQGRKRGTELGCWRPIQFSIAVDDCCASSCLLNLLRHLQRIPF